MTTPSISIVMPAFNEEVILATSVGEVVNGMRARGASFEVIVVENGSTDRTLAVARDLAEQYAEVRVEHRLVADYGAALRHGLLCAEGEWVVNFDCDYYDVGFLDDALERLAHDPTVAIVVGSKRAEGADDRRAWPRRVVTAVFSTILRVAFGLHVSDTHGMKALRRDAVAPQAEASTLGRDLFDTELVLRVERAGLGTAEIAVAVEERRPARTSILRRVPRTLVGLVRLKLALR